MVEEGVLVQVIKDNVSIMTKNTETLDRVYEELKGVRVDFGRMMDKYDSFGKILIEIKTTMKIATGGVIAIFITFITSIGLWALIG